MLNEIFRESVSESQMSIFYTEERAMREILRSRSDRCQVERQGFANAAVGDIFGWSTQYRCEDNNFLFSFTKTFRNQSAAHVMDTNWVNSMKMVSYRSASEIATQRWHVRCAYCEGLLWWCLLQGRRPGGTDWHCVMGVL